MKAGRNDPCPCGSGKKYKKCCLAKTFIQVGKQESVRKQLIDDLLKFYNKHYKDSIEHARIEYWDDFEPETYLEESDVDFAYQNFFEWIVFDFIIDPDKNKTLIDFYIEQNKKLSQDEHQVLTIMKNACISLYEVQEVFPDKGLLLKDLLMGGEYDVQEKMATRALKKWDIFATRLLLIDGQYVMSGAVYPYHIKEKQEIIDDLLTEYNDYLQDVPDGTMDMFLKESGDIFNFHWYYPIQHPEPLKMQTTSGEPLLFSKAIFDIKNGSAVIKALPGIKGFEESDDGFTWFDKKKKDGSATIMGNVTIKDGKLMLECNSKERLERGKKLILKAMPDAVVHKVDTFQDPAEAMKAYKEKSPENIENEIPMDIQQQLYTKFMQNHYEKWFDDKISALGNKTPLDAIKADEGKQKVIELLKMYENGEEQNKKKGRPFYDMSWVWEKLGLEKD